MVDDVRPPSSLQAREASASLHDFSLGLVSPSPPLQDASHEKLRTAPRIHSSSGPSKGTTAAAASLAKVQSMCMNHAIHSPLARLYTQRYKCVDILESYQLVWKPCFTEPLARHHHGRRQP